METTTTPEETPALIDGALSFNAIVINRGTDDHMQVLIVRDLDSIKNKMRIKIPGGMMNKCDEDPKCWLKEIERLMREKKDTQRFRDDEIMEILKSERDLISCNDPSRGTHSLQEYGAIREGIEEISVLVKNMTHLHFWLKEKNLRVSTSMPVNYNFFFVNEYAAPKGWNEDFTSSDKDVKGKLWVSQNELLSMDHDPNILKIIGTHRPALVKMQEMFSGQISEQVSVWE